MSSACDVYILGTPFSGSTFVGNLLNAHPEVFSAGEVSHLFADFPLGDKSRFCPLCVALGRPCPVFDESLMSRIQADSKACALQHIRRRVGKQFIVDGSKFPLWLEQVLAAPLADPSCRQAKRKVILLARSPFGFCASAKRRPGFALSEALAQWSGLYQHALTLLSDQQLPWTLLRFEQLLQEPAVCLASVCEFLGLGYDDAMLRFWLQPAHSLGGNTGAYMWYQGFAEGARFPSGEDAAQAQAYQDRQFDVCKATRWKSQLSAEEILLIQHHAGVRDMAAILGYELDKLVTQSIYQVNDKA